MTEFLHLIWKVLHAAYTQVSLFVALTLLLFFVLERSLEHNDLPKWLYQGPCKVLGSALLGAIPGCGGAIFVVTRYASGTLTFGCLVSVLTSTMGDASFLLLAKEPVTAGGIIALSCVVGTLSGWLVDLTHPKGFMVSKKRIASNINCEVHTWAPGSYIWVFFLVINLPNVYLVISQQSYSDFGVSTYWQMVAHNYGSLAAVFIVIQEMLRYYYNHWRPSRETASFKPGILDECIETTNFVTLWVIAAFLIYEVPTWLFSIDIAQWLTQYKLLIPLMTCIIAIIPSCGPQIVVTTLYLSGNIPLSAQIANALANDGDALLPIIALNPKAALLSTVYSFVPAIIIGYLMLALGY